jgi:hypothetical protein
MWPIFTKTDFQENPIFTKTDFHENRFFTKKAVTEMSSAPSGIQMEEECRIYENISFLHRFAGSIFTKLAIIERHCMEFHSNPSSNTDSTVRNSFTHLTEVRFTKPVFTQIVLALQRTSLQSLMKI